MIDQSASWKPLIERLGELVGRARVQKISVRDSEEIALVLYAGEKIALTLSPRRGTLWFGPPEAPAPARPKGAQGLLRKDFTKAALVEVESLGTGVVLRFDSKQGARALVLERDPTDCRALILGPEDRVLYVIGKVNARDGRNLKRGQTWTPGQSPRLTEPLTQTPSAAPSGAPILKSLRRERKRVQRLVANLSKDLNKHGDPVSLRQQGEALKLVMHTLKRGMNEVDAFGTQVVLDPSLGPVANLERLFKRAQRAQAARSRVLPRQTDAQSRLRQIAELIEALSVEDPDAELTVRAQALVSTRPELGGGARRRAPERARQPFRRFLGRGEIEILVGRSAKDSDDLTFHVARSDDLWLHARDTTGAHVIVRAAKGKEPPRSLLEDAKLLAIWFSSRRGELWDVQIARRRHVRKPGKNAAPGLVFVHKERVERTLPDEDRVKTLLATEGTD